MDGSASDSRSNFPAFVFLGHWCASFLGPASLGVGLPIRSKRRQRRCGRITADRVIYASLDERDSFTPRLRAWASCVWAPYVLAMAPLAGCRVDRYWRRSDCPYLTVRCV